jgi:hypothetical protein
MLFRIYIIEKRQKNKKNKKEKRNKTKNTYRILKRRLRQLPGSEPPPNPGLPPLLQSYRPLLQRQVLTAKCHGGRSLPLLQTAV